LKKLNSYKSVIYLTIFGSFLGLIVLLYFLYHIFYSFSIGQEIRKTRLMSDIIVDFRNYLAKVAPCVHSECKNEGFFACSPAYAVNQVAKTIRDKNHFLVRQVSDKYRNIKDKPNWMELKAINYFKTHPSKKEFYQVHNPHKNSTGIFAQKHIFYARVLKIKPSCLKCHGDPKKDVPPELYKVLLKNYGNRAFGYKVGDVRGIIAMYIPFGDVTSFLKISMFILIFSFLVIFVIGSVIFKKLTDNIREDIEKIIRHFYNKIMKKKFEKIDESMHYKETEILKEKINNVVEELNEKFYFHPITHLYNRNKFFQLKEKYPLVILNVDKFREINNYFGITIGDKLIKEIAKRLEKLKKNYKFKIFHLDIDEFVLLFPEAKNREYLKRIVEEIIKELEKNYNIENNEISLRFRAGISFKEKSYLCAEMALEAAKEENKDIEFCNNVKHYFKKYEEHLKWLTKIKKAINENRIKAFYQPIVDKNKKIIKYEALVRMIDEDGKVVSPFFFLDVAKKTRYYLDITKIMLDNVIEKIKSKNIAISINLSLEDINDIEMRNYVIEKIKTLENKSLLTIEIVETENVRNSEEVFEFLQNVKKLGVEIYIDDFGSGYANFDYLLTLNPDGIKIDGSLIKNILENENNQKIVKTIVSFAKEAKIKTIAEFVENEEIFEYLKSLDIDYFQGYYFSPPREDI